MAGKCQQTYDDSLGSRRVVVSEYDLAIKKTKRAEIS